ncbi:MAG: tRNA-dihydrouridine synthase [Candidatus Peregrinibacteria bacterium]|nr:tRNA-dihydrouridine synthase [Candidatus Peregrinibacteria bacterium]MDZ4244535.1 tRNA-dihydrouridine synthase [Candidatus Gracilibacteria bacterium]
MPKFSWNNLPHPIICLAPMAGYTDSAYRQLIKMIAPEVICFTEFTNVKGLKYGSKRTLAQVGFNPEIERPIVAQIFGKEPDDFAGAAKMLEEMGVDAIDINMGCPAKKVVSSDHGSALFKNPNLAAQIVEATAKATSLPVSIKMRLGTKDKDAKFLIDYCKEMESCGAALITIHGRTAKQMYTGIADYELIYEVKKNVKIPVIGNGDVVSVESAKEKLGNLDGLMIGRGTMGNPWLMAEVWHAFHDDKNSPDYTPYVPPLTFSEKLPWTLKHMELSVETKGEKRGVMEMRKYLAMSVKDFHGASEYRQRLVRMETYDEAKKLLLEINEHFGDLETKVVMMD